MLLRCARSARSPQTGPVLVHYSSDFVFNGDTDRPYTEDDRGRRRASKLVGK